MMMADVVKLDAPGMPHLGLSSADGKDAYIGWLKSEFAAANAIIDSMCQHVRAIGSSGDYDTVFNCLNRRRHTWTPTLYMQQFFSVAEIVNSLQEVAQKKHLAHCSSSLANVTSNSQHAICQAGINELGSSHTKYLKSINQCQQLLIDNSQGNTQHVSENVAISPGNAPLEAGAVNGPPHSFKNTPRGATCDNIIPCEVVDVSPTNPSNNREESEAMEQVSLLDSEGLDAIKLLNTEVAIASKEDESRRASIKRSVQFQCCELVDGQMINDGESGELCESVFSSKEVDELIEVISQLHAAGRQGALGCAFSSCKKLRNKPDIIRFGPNYNDGAKLNAHLYMPRFLQAMIKWFTSCGILSAKRRPDSCLISIFNEGDFESPNTDHGTWERPLCLISLSGNCNMVFGHFITSDKQGNCKGPFQVTIPAGSVLLIQEKFAGILQKAVPASPSKRIIIALGKAITSTARLSYTNAQGKARNKAQIGHYPVTLKQARLAGGISMHALPHMIPPPPLPTIQPIFAFPNSMSLVNSYNPNPTMLQGWSHAPASPGTGVFFPSTELNSVSTWHSGLLVSVAAGVEVRRSGHSKKTERYVKARGTFDTALATKQKVGKLSSPSLSDGTGCALTTST